MAFVTNQNRRIFYATKGVAIGDMGATGVVDSWGTSTGGTFDGSGNVIIMHGLQSVGITTNFPLESITEIGQLSLYENVEDVPDIEVSVQKILDGYTLVYHAGSVAATDPTLTGRQNARADFRMIVGVDTDSSVTAGDDLVSEIYCSGLYWGNISYNLPTDGSFTEDVTFQGNNKVNITSDAGSVLLGAGGTVHSAFNFGDDSPDSPDSGVMRRNNFVTGTGHRVFGGNSFITVLPDFIEGISNNGSSLGQVGAAAFVNCGTVNTDNVHVQSINFSVNATRESINHLGALGPYYRYINFPTEVTTTIEVIATSIDNVDATELNTGGNVTNHTIQVVLDDTTVFQLGNKNKLTSINFGGGNADGGNDTITYNMSNNNDFVVLHSGDPAALESTGYFRYWFE
jgi:hypothetical protein